jgi:hypothetical protein
MRADEFHRILETLGEQGAEDVAWAQGIKPPADAVDFAQEVIFVICNSGMKNTVARGIYERVIRALSAGLSATSAFGHPGKSAAIDAIWRDREHLFETWKISPDQLAAVEALPWIGSITKYHVAKNFGMDVAKPDVHLMRLATLYHTTPQELCADLSKKTGLRVATIDTVLWRACANGVLNAYTGEITSPPLKHTDGR